MKKYVFIAIALSALLWQTPAIAQDEPGPIDFGDTTKPGFTLPTDIEPPTRKHTANAGDIFAGAKIAGGSARVFAWGLIDYGSLTIDARFNLNTHNGLELLAGKRFGNERISVMPEVGIVAGHRDRGLTAGFCVTRETFAYGFSHLLQYSVGISGHDDFFFQQCELLVKTMLPIVEVGLSNELLRTMGHESETDWHLGPMLKATSYPWYGKISYSTGPADPGKHQILVILGYKL